MKKKNYQNRNFSITSEKKLNIVYIVFLCVLIVFSARLCILMIADAEKYGDMALKVQQRERSIKAPRGLIYDRNGELLAGNITVCSISVIHSQLKEPEKVISVLSEKLDMDEEQVRKKVLKVSVREKIKSNVDKSVADEIRLMKLDGVMVDEDYKRYYPYDSLASKILGFAGADNQGIVGLEVSYDEYLMGQNGSINTKTDAKGIELINEEETRTGTVSGDNLITTLDINIQKFVTNLALKVLEEKKAKRVAIVVMNPQNGEIYAACDVPEYNLNKPFEIAEGFEAEGNGDTDMNRVWRFFLTSDTYEPGSTFKIITSTAALENGKVSVDDSFYCPGYRIVADRRIRCHKTTGHGQETFKQGIMNSCNPVFMDVGARVGVDDFYEQLERLGLFEKTGIDMPGEANSIFHKKENVGPLELATMSFGQSFQITPFQMLRAVSAVINGGRLVTPHFGMKVESALTGEITVLDFDEKEGACSDETSLTMRTLLEAVVSEGTGKNAFVSDYRTGGKTATSEKLPRGNGKYIASFIGFAPADNPEIITLILIDEPQGVYYGGTVAAPVAAQIYKNVLPYLGIQKE